MASSFDPDIEVVAIDSVHAPCTIEDVDITRCLPVLQGEVLKIIRDVSNHQVLVENKNGIQGHVSKKNLYAADIYHNEDFYLCDFTTQMAETFLSDKASGTFIVRSKTKEHDKLVISAAFNNHVKHYFFQKKDGGVEYNGTFYQSVPSFVNKCSCEKVLEEKLGTWIKQSDINIPQATFNESAAKSVPKQSLNLRVVAGNLAVAVEDFFALNKLCLSVTKGCQYEVVRASRNPMWLIARDEQKKEGYVPSCVLECFIPQWFHGRLERDESERRLRKLSRDGTFLVKERMTKPGTYALSVWTPDGQMVHVPLAYHEGKIMTGNSLDLPTFDCILDLVEHYRKETRFWTVDGECIRILFPLSRKESQLPDEIMTMDMQSVEMYCKALKEGKEHVRDIRLMVIGHHGAGKTTLTERLMGKPFTQVGSTNGIEIHLRQCQYNVKSEEWLNMRPGSAYLDDDEAHRLRLLRVLESPDEERTNILDDLAKARQSPVDALFGENGLSKSNSGDFSHNNSTASLRLLEDSPSSIKGSPSSMKGSPLTKDFGFSFSDSDQSNYMIENDTDDVSRYKFSEGTLKVIEKTFGRKRHDSGKDKIGFISMWDFAGQYIFYATHQVFLTPRAVYLLVLDLSKGLKDFVVDEEFPLESSETQGRLVQDYCDFWMRSIHTFCGEIPGYPPVILVGTHKNKQGCKPEEEEAYAERYFERFRKLIEQSPVSAHLQPEQFAIDNTENQAEFDRLKKAIIQVAKRQIHWNQEIPARWLPLERALCRLRSDRTVISVNDVIEADKQNEIGINNADEILLFLKYQHAVGSLIYFEDEDLVDSIVLDPQWIIDAFKSIITAQKFCNVRPQLRPLWTLMQERAILKDKLIMEIWSVEKEGRFLTNRELLLSYMEKLDIIARPNIKDEEGKPVEIDYYFVPSLLRRKGVKTDLMLSSQRSNICTPNLCFVFQEGFIPPMVFQRMLGACLARYSVLRVGGEVQIFCDLGVFQLDSKHCFIFWLDQNIMKVKVMNTVQNKVQPPLCDKLRRFLTTQLDRELCRYQQNTSFSVCIECLKPERTTDELLNCKELLKQEKLPCFAHSRPHSVEASLILQSWYPDYIDLPQGQTTQHSWIDQLPSVIRKREVTPKDLSKIAQSLGFNWEFVLIELGLSQPEIDRVKMDYKDQTAMQIYKSLLTWKGRAGFKANLENLVKAIQTNQTVVADWEAIKNVVDRI